MKAKTLQILWHGKEPVWSVDFHKDGYLATSGADKEIKLWKVGVNDEGFPQVQHLETLTGHNKGINTIRFSPSGEMLVSGGDAGEIMLWRPTGAVHRRDPPAKKDVEIPENFTWKAGSVLRGHNDDVQDVSWAPASNLLLSGSVDNSCIVWDPAKAKAVTRIADHRHYVQGVAWDPAGNFLVTQSGDRTCRVYAAVLPTSTGKKVKAIKPEEWSKYLTCMHTLSKREVEEAAPTAPTEGEPPSENSNGGKEVAAKAKATKQCLFHDDTVPSLFRRLAWAPDGSFLALPTGLHKRDTSSPAQNTLYLYSRKCFTRPAAHVPGFNSPVVAIRFCPRLFVLLPEDSSFAKAPTFNLPYRILFAVATIDSVVIMDTQRMTPLALVGGMHFTSITDLAWSADSRQLVVASSDGYCSVVVFDEGELGTPLPSEDIPENVHKILFPDALTASAKEATSTAAEVPRTVLPLETTGEAAASDPAAVGPQSPPMVPATIVDATGAQQPMAAEAVAASKTNKRRITPVAVAPAVAPAAAPVKKERQLITPMPLTEHNSPAPETIQQTTICKVPRRITPQAVAPTPALAAEGAGLVQVGEPDAKVPRTE